MGLRRHTTLLNVIMSELICVIERRTWFLVSFPHSCSCWSRCRGVSCCQSCVVCPRKPFPRKHRQWRVEHRRCQQDLTHQSWNHFDIFDTLWSLAYWIRTRDKIPKYVGACCRVNGHHRRHVCRQWWYCCWLDSMVWVETLLASTFADHQFCDLRAKIWEESYAADFTEQRHLQWKILLWGL